MTILGAVFLPQLPPERLRSVAVAADEAGLAELWLWEDCFLESGVATAAAALAWTRNLSVGVGLLPVPLRNVAVAAMEVATLHRLFPDRLLVGVGHGVQDWMGQVGARVESPVTLLTEHLAALRALLRGERVSTSGRYVRLDGVALDWPPAGGPNGTVPPIAAGAVGPRTLRLSGAAADGTILTAGTTPDGVRAARRLIDAAVPPGVDAPPWVDAPPRVDAPPWVDAPPRVTAPSRVTAPPRVTAPSRVTAPHRVTVYVHAATGPDAGERLERERVRWGYESLDDIVAVGDAAAFAEAVAGWAAAGADAVIFQPTPDDPDPEGFMQFVAGEVRPLVAD